MVSSLSPICSSRYVNTLFIDNEAHEYAQKKEIAYHEEKLATREAAQNAIKEELAIQALKFVNFKKDLQDGNYKVVNKNVPK